MSDEVGISPEVEAPEVVFSTKAEYEESVRSHINKALAPKLKKLEQMEAQIAELGDYRTKAEELEAKIAGQGKDATDRFETERTQWQKQHDALTAEIERRNAEAQAIKNRWHDSHRREVLTALAIEAGAAPSAAPDIPSLFPRDLMQVTETDNGLKASMLDPTTGLEKDPKEVMSAWLLEKPHLMGPRPGGSGSPGSSAAKPAGPKDPLEGKYGTDAFTAAFYPNKT